MSAAALLVRLYMRTLSLVHPNRTGRTLFGHRLSCDIRDFIQRRIYFFGVYEPNLTQLMINMLQPGDTFVDVGANVGYFSLLASALVGNSGRGIAIEASPQTFRALKSNLDQNGIRNVRAINLAATGQTCRVQVQRLDARNSGKNVVKADRLGDVNGEALTQILGSDIADANFIKIDIEGSEGPVLQDILDNLTRFPPRLVVVAEMTESSAHFVRLFRKCRFRSFSDSERLQNRFLLSVDLPGYAESRGSLVLFRLPRRRLLPGN